MRDHYSRTLLKCTHNRTSRPMPLRGGGAGGRTVLVVLVQAVAPHLRPEGRCVHLHMQVVHHFLRQEGGLETLSGDHKPVL